LPADVSLHLDGLEVLASVASLTSKPHDFPVILYTSGDGLECFFSNDFQDNVCQMQVLSQHCLSTIVSRLFFSYNLRFIYAISDFGLPFISLAGCPIESFLALLSKAISVISFPW
jgi:hypothetical protein